MIIAQVAQ